MINGRVQPFRLRLQLKFHIDLYEGCCCRSVHREGGNVQEVETGSEQFVQNKIRNENCAKGEF